MSLSKDLTDQFKERMQQTHDAADLDVTFSVMVLGTNFWPLNAPTNEYTIPREIQPTYERFQRYYQAKHDTLSFEEIVTATAISKEILSQVLGLLTKAKILISEEKDQYDLNPSMSPFVLSRTCNSLVSHSGFKSKKVLSRSRT
jgi:cullin 1